MQDKHTLSHSQGLTRGPYTLSWLKRTCRNPLFQALSVNIPVRIQVFSSGRAKGLQVLPKPQLKRADQMENTQFNILHHLVPFIRCASAPGLVPRAVPWEHPPKLPRCYSHTPHSAYHSKIKATSPSQPPAPEAQPLLTLHNALLYSLYFNIFTFCAWYYRWDLATFKGWPRIQQT